MKIKRIVILGSGILSLSVLLLTYQNCGVANRDGVQSTKLSEMNQTFLKAKRASSLTTDLRPNIVFVLVDDMSFSDLQYLPKLKSLLIDNGMLSSKYYTPTPLCCPSRVSTLRGQFAHNTKVYANGGRLPGGHDVFFENGLASSTVATWLKDSGYATALYGKYLNNYRNMGESGYWPPGWSEWAGLMRKSHSPYDYSLNINGTTRVFGSAESDYQTDVLSDMAVNFINRQKGPFFVYLGITAPHRPQRAALRHRRAIDAGLLQSPVFNPSLDPSFNEADVRDKPDWVRNRESLSDVAIADIGRLFKDRIESLYAVEDAVEKIVNTLKTNNVYENTYIFFVSDNGYHLGSHRLKSGKNTSFETDIRVPFIVIGPNVRKGTNNTHFIANIDLAPTWAEIADVTPQDFVDGASLIPIISANRDLPASWRRDMLFEHMGEDTEEESTGDEDNRQPANVGIRSLNFKYIIYSDGTKEFYDMAQDPYELKNVITDVSYSKKIQRSQRRLEQLKDCAGAGCRQFFPTDSED